MGHRSRLKLVKPSQQAPQSLGIAGSFKLAGLMVGQSFAENDRLYLNNRPKVRVSKGDFSEDSVHSGAFRVGCDALSEIEQ